MRAAAAAFNGKVPAWFPEAYGYTNVGISGSGSSEEYLKAYRGWVYGAVRIVSDVAAAGRLKFYYENNRGDKVYLNREHPLVSLMRHPNTSMTRWFFWSLTFKWLELTGKAYWYKVRDNLGVVRMLIPLQPNWMKIVPSDTEVIQGFLLESGGKHLAFAKEDIVFLRYPHPYKMYDGMGPLEAASYSYDTDFNMHKLDKTTFEKGGMPKGALMTDQYVDETESKRMRILWKQLYGNQNNQESVAVLHSGLKYQAIEVTRKDMEYAEGRRMTRQEIFAIFGVSEGLLGMVEDVNKTNNIALMDSFIRFTMQPKAEMIQAQIDKDLVADFDDRIETEYELPKALDVIEEHSTMEVRLRSKLTSINEERERMNLPPVSWGDVPWGSYSDIQLDQIAEANQASNTDSDRFQDIHVIDMRKWSEERKEVLWRAFIAKLHGPMEKRYKNTMVEYFREQQAAVIANFNKAVKRSYDPALVEAVLFDIKEWNAKMGKKIEPRMVEIIKEAIKKELADLALKKAIDYNSPLIKEFIANKVFRLPQLVNSLTHEELRAIISQAFKDNLTADAVAEKINRYFDGQNPVRAMRIARTEITNASNFGIQESWRQIGTIKKKVWLSARDEVVRVAHRDVEERSLARPVDYDQPFIVAGVNMMYPGDQSAPPHLVVNCRCTMVAEEMS